MQLFNNGERKIVLKDQTVEPKSLFEVTDKEGKKLMELFANEVVEPSTIVKDDAKGDLAKIKAERDEAIAKVQELETQLADFEAIKAERDEAKKAIEKLEAEVAKLKK